MPTFTKRQIALARSAGALSSVPFVAPRDGESANAFAMLLAAFDGNADNASACYTFASAPDIKPVAKRATKPAPDADAERARHEANDAAAKAAHDKANAKPEKPSKPADTSASAAYAERVALIDALRGIVSGLYNGPSLAVRSNPKRVAASVYADLFAAPKHRTDLSKISVRDESALFLIVKRGETNGSFDPVALNLDSGIFSRLRSVGFIVADGPDAYMLSTDAIAHARKAAKRAA